MTSEVHIEAAIKNPTAAVVGAGIAGVHVAHELAQIGFDVTVFEESSTIAGGATRHTLPFVGVGLLEPALASMRWRSGLWKALLVPYHYPDVIVRDHPFHSLLSLPLYRWLRGRSASIFNPEEVMFYTDNLSKLSVSVIEEYCHKYPELRQHIITDRVMVRRLLPSSDDVNPKLATIPTAHPSPIMIDAEQWTKGLARICQRLHHVKFLFHQRVEAPNVNLTYDVERTRSLTVSTPDPQHPSNRLYREEDFDVVVLAAGAATGKITAETSRLPILGMTGWATAVRGASGVLKDRVTALFPSREKLEVALLQLCASCSLFAYDLPSPDTEDERDYYFSGLLSLDTTQPTEVSPSYAEHSVDRLERYLQVKCNVDIPLTEQGGVVQLRSYVRGFTPDGVPLVDHSGGSYNTFVCSGFGDHDADFAPGAAKILSKLVEHRAQQLLEDDYTYVSSKGVFTDARNTKVNLPPPTLQKVTKELNHLLQGELPPASVEKGSKRWFDWFRPSPSPDSVPATEEEVHADVTNPYSTDRFKGLVPKSVPQVVYHSLFTHVYRLEDYIVQYSEPVAKAMRRGIVKFAQSEYATQRVREFVFFNFYDASYDDEEEIATQKAINDALNQVSERMEAGKTEKQKSEVEKAIEKQQYLEEKARTMYMNKPASNGSSV